jgi:predicted amidohydrolase YtcJ
MTTTLFRNAHVHDSGATALAVEDGRIAWLGSDDGAQAYDGADEVADLGGRLLTPAFVDAHVHTVGTGQQLEGLDLSVATSRDHALDLLAARAAARPDDDVLLGAGWDETGWPDPAPPTADELERAAPGRAVHLLRVDCHSALVSHALLGRVPEELDGRLGHGWLARAAKQHVLGVLDDLVGPDQRLSAARAALREHARHGVGAVHENAAPHIGPDWEVDVVRRAAGEVGTSVTAYWGELCAWGAVERLAVDGLAGDLSADGSIGSRTACFHEPYDDAAEPGHRGHAYLTAEQVTEHVVGCTERGIQAGFHCIGDAGIDAVAEGFAQAAEKTGVEAVRAARHRVEHLELPSPKALRTLADLAVVVSAQPMFDGLWGGPGGAYDGRLGERWRRMNPLADIAAAPLALAFGSDTPVTRIGPWQAVQAAVHHRTPGQGLPPEDAFRAHTVGGWWAARVDDAGLLRPGHRATLAVWDVDRFPDLAPGAALPRCLRTVVDGRTVFADPSTGSGRRS